MEQEHLLDPLGEAVDRLLTVPMSIQVAPHAGRPFTFDLYEGAREKVGGPLALRAAQALIRAVHPGDVVLISTGFVIPNWLRAETDGPPGAALLARALALGLEAAPVFVLEDFLADVVLAPCRAAGLQPVSSVHRVRAVPLRVTALPFPLEVEAARTEARRILDELRPAALVAIERPSWNEKGVYHPGAGIDFSSMVAKVDCLFEEATARGILTIGVGDHGGEIGFGLIQETAKRVLPMGTTCRCPCQSGIAAATATQALVVCAPPSNRGANGIVACLAACLGHGELLHSSSVERRVLAATAASGAIDSTSGLAEPVTDRVPEEINLALIDILHEVIRPALRADFFKERHRTSWTEKHGVLQERTRQWQDLMEPHDR